jgi:FtsH-binding integral membrane protein
MTSLPITFEGLALGSILESYLTSGMGTVVLNAALTTAAIALAAGAYGYTSRRDLSGIGVILTLGLVGVIVASLVGIFLRRLCTSRSRPCPRCSSLDSWSTNRVAQSRGVSQGGAILLAVGAYLDVFNLFVSLLQVFELGRRED